MPEKRSEFEKVAKVQFSNLSFTFVALNKTRLCSVLMYTPPLHNLILKNYILASIRLAILMVIPKHKLPYFEAFQSYKEVHSGTKQAVNEFLLSESILSWP